MQPKKVRKNYTTRTKELQLKLKEEFLKLYDKGFATDLILLQLSKNHFLGKSRINQLVKARELTKNRVRTCDIIDAVNL